MSMKINKSKHKAKRKNKKDDIKQKWQTKKERK